MRPEPTGDIKAYFPQKRETLHIRENGEAYITRWRRYLDDLGSSAAPKDFGSWDFRSQVRQRMPGTTGRKYTSPRKPPK